MSVLGAGLFTANHHDAALSVQEIDLAMTLRLGAPEQNVLVAQSNLANTYYALGRLEEALPLRRVVYSRTLRLSGEEGYETLAEAINYSSLLISLGRYEEARSLLRKTMPVARRVLGESHELALKTRWAYAQALYKDPAATLDDLNEAVATLEELERTARRVLGGAHPDVSGIEYNLRNARAALAAREGVESIREGVEAMMPGAA